MPIVEIIKQPKPKGRNLDLVAQASETLRDSSGIGPVRDEADYDERVALLNPLIDTVQDDEAHPLAGLMEIAGEILAGKRAINARQAKLFAARFNVSAAAFI